MVMFEFDGDPVPALTADGKRHTDASIPAGIVKDDALDLTVTYTPDGDMGEGEFEIRLPSGWDAEDVQGEGVERSGKIVTVSFPHDRFGEGSNDSLEITLIDITVPNTHGNHGFLAKSKNKGGTLKQLSERPVAFVGNAEAANDTVKVEITPAAAYQNNDDVDFDITVTANGPMHDSNIQITVPDGIVDLQTDKSADPNHVRKISASVSGVTIAIDGAEGNEIIISTGKLNADGKIKVRLENVDLDGVSADPDTGFLVATRTRGSEDDLSDVAYEPIEKDDGARSITGGLIRTVAGSGVLAVEPATIEQGSRNKNIKLTLTATTDLPDAGMDLVITVPSVIETQLQEAKSSDDGYVSFTGKFHKDVEADDKLKIDGTTITFTKILLKRGGKFVTTIKGVDLLEDTGNFPLGYNTRRCSTPCRG